MRSSVNSSSIVKRSVLTAVGGDHLAADLRGQGGCVAQHVRRQEAVEAALGRGAATVARRSPLDGGDLSTGDEQLDLAHGVLHSGRATSPALPEGSAGVSAVR
jgi:hypothetical protein